MTRWFTMALGKGRGGGWQGGGRPTALSGGDERDNPPPASEFRGKDNDSPEDVLPTDA